MNGYMNNSINVRASITGGSNIKGANLQQENIKYNTTLDVSGSFPPYDGSYDIIPRTEDQELNTKNKTLINNMLVESIPYYETSNESGKTVYIG